LIELVGEGALRGPVIDRELPLKQAAEAHRLIENRENLRERRAQAVADSPVCETGRFAQNATPARIFAPPFAAGTPTGD
jgi:hypothetical protein